MECFINIDFCLMIVGPCWGLTLSENGQTRYTIGLDERACGTEKTSAQELQKYLKLVTGADFPILSTNKIAGPAILIGSSEKVKKLASDVDWTSLGTEGTVIKTVGDDLLLAGSSPRGTLMLFIHFLKILLGYDGGRQPRIYPPKNNAPN